MSYHERHRPGLPLGADNPFLSTADARVKDTVEELQRRRLVLPPQTTATAPAAPSLTLRYGLVDSGNDATWNNDEDSLQLDDVRIWPFLKATGLPPYDTGTAYSTGDRVYYTAPAHSETETYTSGQEVSHDPGSGARVYRCLPAGAGPGVFNGTDWDLITTVGPKMAETATTAGPFDASDWDNLSADNWYIDRDGDTVTIPWPFTFEPVQGSMIGWVEETGDIIVASCGFVKGFEAV